MYMNKMENDIVVPTKPISNIDLSMIFTIGQKRTQRINYIIHLIIVITSLNLQLNLVLLRF